MTDQPQQGDAVSRRGLITGAAALGAGIAALGTATAHAAPPPTEVVAAQTNGLSYVQYDALAFFPYTISRLYQLSTGVQPSAPANWIAAPLSLPVGSVITEVSVAYQVQPVLTITRRDMASPNPPSDVFQETLAAGGGAKTQTVPVTTPVTIEYGSTYILQFFCSAGDSVFGATVGYVPPTRSFIPFQGLGGPRVLDTRVTGGKFQPNEERTLALGFPGARGAVLNLTVTETEGGGFAAVFRGDIEWPGNSTLNWSETGQILSNGVITDVDASGQITIRAGANRTHVVVDRIGWLI
ncbi:MAG: hypothetical protein AB7L17_10140 [Ilumatobacteraceae bacterium]